MMMWYGGDWGWGGWILMTVAMVAFWALLITAVVIVVRYLLSPHRTDTTPGTLATQPRISSPNVTPAATSTMTSTSGGWRCCARAGDGAVE
jgi:hypothetical protein